MLVTEHNSAMCRSFAVILCKSFSSEVLLVIIFYPQTLTHNLLGLFLVILKVQENSYLLGTICIFSLAFLSVLISRFDCLIVFVVVLS